MDLSREIQDELLSNGVRVITEHNSTSLASSIGFWVNVGSRDEVEELWGCSHFLEHLLFKGTEIRSAQEISSTIENKGGYLNAFTDRDMTAYLARIMRQDQGIATDLLLDMIENSILAEPDANMERKVVLEEIKQTWDNPASLIHTLYSENIWRGNPIAHPIGGTIETISKMPIELIKEYYKENYGSKIIAVATGSIDHERLVNDIENFIQKGKGKRVKDRLVPEHFPGLEYKERDMGQVHLSISTPGSSFGSKDAITQTIISSYLGVGASSLLFQEIREKRGLVYNVYAYNQSLSDVGAFSIIAGMSKSNLEEVVKIILLELENMKQGLAPAVLEIVKSKTIGSYVLRSESNRERMHQLGLSTLRNNVPKTVEEVVVMLDGVTNENIQNVAEKLFNKNKIAITALGISKSEAENMDALVG
jgi:predicted Zn-dependent peptidase